MTHQRTITASRIGLYIVLSGVTLVYAFPLLWLFSTSLKTHTQMFRLPIEWIPRPFAWENYPKALQFFPFFRYLKNTLTIVVVNNVGTLLSSIFVGYGLAKVKWPGRKLALFLIVSTMMLPYNVRMVPLFLIYKNLGWLDTYLPLMVPCYLGLPFYIFLMRQFMITIPDDIIDSAFIDGYGHVNICFRVVAPLCAPALATISLLQFLVDWHDFLAPLIYLSSERKYTLALGLQQFFGLYRVEWGLLMASAAMMTLPVLIVFFFAQRTFIEGIATSGLKG